MLAFTANDQWHPGIGDPTVMGWVTVVVYFLAAVLCGGAARQTLLQTGRWTGAAAFWSVFTLGLVALGINKQLDLQTWLTLFARHAAVAEGWYNQRRTLQAFFVGGVGAAGVASLIALRLLSGRLTRPMWVALTGGVFLVCFVIIRASSFHHVDAALGMDWGGLRVNWILELGSISCIGLGAILEMRRKNTWAFTAALPRG